jgi:hypothetical protein
LARASHARRLYPLDDARVGHRHDGRESPAQSDRLAMGRRPALGHRLQRAEVRRLRRLDGLDFLVPPAHQTRCAALSGRRRGPGNPLASR